MPASPTVLKSIRAIRKLLATPGVTRDHGYELYQAVDLLIRKSGKIVENLESIQAVLAFAPEIEAYRGKGSQSAMVEFSRGLHALIYQIKERLPQSESDPDFFPQQSEISSVSPDTVAALQALADHAFQRVQGPPVRSRHAGDLRSIAWQALALIAPILRRPAHLAHALTVAKDNRASVEERDGAVQYLAAYWADQEPDEATVSLLEALESDPPTRHLLITVLQTQIDLGLNDEFGALFAAEDWDDAHNN